MPARAWNAINEYIWIEVWYVMRYKLLLCIHTSLKQYLFISIIVGTVICIGSSWLQHNFMLLLLNMIFLSLSNFSIKWNDFSMPYWASIPRMQSSICSYYSDIFFSFGKKLLAANYCLCCGVSFACLLRSSRCGFTDSHFHSVDRERLQS